MTAVRVEFPYLKEDTDRHGNVRIYVRRGGCKICIREPKGSPGFARAYAEARDALENPTARGGKSGRTAQRALPWIVSCAHLSFDMERGPLDHRFDLLDALSDIDTDDEDFRDLPRSIAGGDLLARLAHEERDL
jgi:hypothetical protein